MGKRDKRVDAYIARSQPFAWPILEHLRELVHKACKDVEETMKWSFPHFDYKGMMCSMASFKSHCAFSFWKASLMSDKKLVANAKGETAMGHLGRIEKLEDLPTDKVLMGYIREAMKLNDAGAKVEKKKVVKKPVVVPEYLKKALSKNLLVKDNFEGFSPSQKREYIVWITEAKTEATRAKRIAQMLEWVSEGKLRNWRYMKK
jgi:uncharacterized protein YdeI (YjbR/CyaY-like superfamily)